MTARVLIADDETDITESLAYAFRSAGFEVDCEADGEAALEAALRREYDVVVLDVVMPRLAGTEVCRRLRARSPVPIVLLSARDGEIDRIVGLELGADDYVTKPFSTAELVSRVRAILRRREFDRPESAAKIELGDLLIDPGAQRVHLRGAEIFVTPTEFKILLLLARHPGRVFSRTEILQAVWQTSFVADGRSCDGHVYNLRAKIEEEPKHPRRLVTVPGAGYKLLSV